MTQRSKSYNPRPVIEMATGHNQSLMQRVGVKQLKTRLSEYLRAVRRGETILVTDRGEVVAELRPARPRSAAASLDEILDALNARGEITRAAIRKGRWTWKYKGLGLPSGTAAELLDEIRSDRD